MSGISAGNFHALAEKFDFSRVPDRLRRRRRHRAAVDHPRPAPPAPDVHQLRPAGGGAHRSTRAIEAAGVADRVATASGDFFVDPLPQADVITMGMILHDWNLDRKLHLIQRRIRRAAAGRRARRRREHHRRRPPRERLRPDDVAQHAHRVRRRLRLHRCRLSQVVRAGRLPPASRSFPWRGPQRQRSPTSRRVMPAMRLAAVR